MDNFSDRIKSALKGESVNAFAKKCGISETMMRGYTKGSIPGIDKAQIIAEKAGVSLLWLITGEHSEDNDQIVCPSPADNTYAHIPVISANASAGGGYLATDEDHSSWVKFDRAWLYKTWHLNPADLFSIPTIGESMEPTIKAGEYLLASRAERHLKLSDGIYVIRLEGTVLVKRLQLLPGRKLAVSSDNPAYKPYEIELDDGTDFALLGKVVLVHGVRKV